MQCPKCHNPKTRDDFYWRNRNSKTKVRKECKTCLADNWVAKQTQKTKKGYFDLVNFFKQYSY